MALDWSLDELAKFFLAGEAPDQYVLRREPVWLELRGCRAELWLNRLTKGEYVFRQAVSDGRTLECAAELAADVDESFELGHATLAMLHAGLVSEVMLGGRR